MELVHKQTADGVRTLLYLAGSGQFGTVSSYAGYIACFELTMLDTEYILRSGPDIFDWGGNNNCLPALTSDSLGDIYLSGRGWRIPEVPGGRVFKFMGLQ